MYIGLEMSAKTIIAKENKDIRKVLMKNYGVEI